MGLAQLFMQSQRDPAMLERLSVFGDPAARTTPGFNPDAQMPRPAEPLPTAAQAPRIGDNFAAKVREPGRGILSRILNMAALTAVQPARRAQEARQDADLERELVRARIADLGEQRAAGKAGQWISTGNGGIYWGTPDGALEEKRAPTPMPKGVTYIDGDTIVEEVPQADGTVKTFRAPRSTRAPGGPVGGRSRYGGSRSNPMPVNSREELESLPRGTWVSLPNGMTVQRR